MAASSFPYFPTFTQKASWTNKADETQQPSRPELRAFHRQVEPLLNFPTFWINNAMRQAIAYALGEVVRKNKYTCYACALCSNHMHLVILRHKHAFEEMWKQLTDRTRIRLAASHPEIISPHHPVFDVLILHDAPAQMCS